MTEAPEGKHPWRGVQPEPDWYQQVQQQAAHTNPPKAPWDPKPEGWQPTPVTRWQIFGIVLTATAIGHVANDIFIYQYVKAVLSQMADSLMGVF